jgi:ABC-2 type transport system permease protein
MGTELLKLRTTRSPFLLLAAAQLVIIAGVSGLFVGGHADVTDPVTAQRAIAHAGLVSIFSLILGILAVAGEYRHRTSPIRTWARRGAGG